MTNDNISLILSLIIKQFIILYLIFIIEKVIYYMKRSFELKRRDLFCIFLAAILAFFPEAFKNLIVFLLHVSSKAKYFAIIPLPIVSISIFIANLSSSVFLTTNKTSLVIMPIFNYLNSISIFLKFASLIKPNISKVKIAIVMINDCLCMQW